MLGALFPPNGRYALFSRSEPGSGLAYPRQTFDRRRHRWQFDVEVAGQRVQPQTGAVAHGLRKLGRSRFLCVGCVGAAFYPRLAGTSWGVELMSDPMSRLELARQEIDRVFGSGYFTYLANLPSISFERTCIRSNKHASIPSPWQLLRYPSQARCSARNPSLFIERHTSYRLKIILRQ